MPPLKTAHVDELKSTNAEDTIMEPTTEDLNHLFDFDAQNFRVITVVPSLNDVSPPAEVGGNL